MKSLRLLTWCVVLLMAAGCDPRASDPEADGGGVTRHDAGVGAEDVDASPPEADAAEPIPDAGPDAGDTEPSMPDASSEDSGKESVPPTPDEPLPPIPEEPIQPIVALPAPGAGACAFEPAPSTPPPNNGACADGTYRGDVVLATSDDLRKLHGCWRVAGDVRLKLADLSNADGMQALHVIEGSFTADGYICDEGGCRGGNQHLTSLKGFENLRCIGGDMRIAQEDYDFRQAIDLSALRNLVEVGGSFLVSLYSNEKTNTFASLQRVWGDLEHKGHFSAPRLEAVYGGWKRSTADGPIPSGVYVGCGANQGFCRDGVLGCGLGVASQAELEKLDQCELALRDLRIESAEISDLTPLSKLHTVRGRFMITPSYIGYGPGALQHLTGLDALKRVGDLQIGNQPGLLDLHALANLVEAPSISLGGLNALRDLTGLEKIEHTKRLELTNNAGLEALKGLELAGPIENLIIQGSPKLMSVAELADVTGPMRYLTLHALPALESLAGLSKIDNVGNNLEISQCGSLIDVTGLTVSHVSALIIESNAKLESLQGLLAPAATELDALVLRSNPKLTSLTGLEPVEKVNNLLVSECDSLDDLRGLTSLREVSSKLTLQSNATLHGLDGAPELRKVLEIVLEANPVLSDIDGLAQLDQTWLTLKDLPALASLEALSHVSIAVGLRVEQLPALTSLNGLEHISSSMVELQIVNNALLSDISALAGLHSSTWRLFVSDNPALTSLHGLEGLTTVTDMEIARNAELAQLRNLSGLTTGRSIAIYENPELPQCEAEWLAARVTADTFYGGSNDPGGTCAP